MCPDYSNTVGVIGIKPYLEAISDMYKYWASNTGWAYMFYRMSMLLLNRTYIIMFFNRRLTVSDSVSNACLNPADVLEVSSSAYLFAHLCMYIMSLGVA